MIYKLKEEVWNKFYRKIRNFILRILIHALPEIGGELCAMPNWCENSLIVTGEENEIRRFADLARPDGDEGQSNLSLASLYPIPPGIYPTLRFRLTYEEPGVGFTGVTVVDRGTILVDECVRYT